MHTAGRLTAAALCQAVAALQPAGAVVVDESLTSGGSYFSVSRGCPQFSHLTLTGVAAAALASRGRAPTAKAPQIDMLCSPGPGLASLLAGLMLCRCVALQEEPSVQAYPWLLAQQ